MTLGAAARFAVTASGAALVGAVALIPWLRGDDPQTAAFAAAGFLAMAIPGIAGGAWLTHEHGRPSSSFVLALAAGFTLRLLLAATATALAMKAGAGAIAGLLPGLAAGFLPLTVFEIVWFLRKSSTRDLKTESRG